MGLRIVVVTRMELITLKPHGTKLKKKQEMHGTKENVDDNIIEKRKMKMICPECGCRTMVVDYKRRGTKALYRRYECKNCKKRFSTLENYFVAPEKKVSKSKDKAITALEIVALELGKAKSKHPDFPESAEGGGMIIAEEYAELTEAARKFFQGINDQRTKYNLIEEAAHVAVTAIRFIENML